MIGSLILLNVKSRIAYFLLINLKKYESGFKMLDFLILKIASFKLF